MSPTVVRTHLRRGRVVRKHVRFGGIGTRNNTLFDFDNGDRVGRITLYLRHGEPKTVMLYELLIDEPYRRQGYGSAALQEAEKEARRVGAKYMLIDEPSEAGFALYSRRGYRFRDTDSGSLGGEVMYKRLR